MESTLKVKLLEYTPNPDMVVAKAAKLCYSPIGIDDMELTDEEVRKFVKMLGSMSHFSTFEHVSFTFALEGISRALTHQLVRHRIASFSQQSQRYVKLSQFEYIVPPQIASDPVAKKIYLDVMEADQRAYDSIYDRLLFNKAKEYGIYEKYTAYVNEELFNIYKIKSIPPVSLVDESIMESYDSIKTLGEFWIDYDKTIDKRHRLYSKTQKTIIEDCRYVFPNACETKICVTMNARSLMNFFHHRCCNRAQWEIRELAEEMCKLVQGVAPAIFAKAGPNCVSGSCPEGAMCCGKQTEMRDKYEFKLK